MAIKTGLAYVNPFPAVDWMSTVGTLSLGKLWEAVRAHHDVAAGQSDDLPLLVVAEGALLLVPHGVVIADDAVAKGRCHGVQSNNRLVWDVGSAVHRLVRLWRGCDSHDGRRVHGL